MKQTFVFDKAPYVAGAYSIVGPKEGLGPLGKYFSLVLEDDLWGEKTFEKCEIKMHREAIKGALDSAGMNQHDLDAVIGADLLNQIVAASFAARDIDAVFLGMYGACSSFGESLAIAAFLLSGGFMKTVSCSTSSHFSGAERQYRFPLEYGNQRTPTSQWTVTGAGATLLTSVAPEGEGVKVKLTAATLGKVIDLGIDDESNMGAAMAPAAADTLIKHFSELERSPSYYDAIYTGDLGKYGTEILRYLTAREGYNLPTCYSDCGAIIYGYEQKALQGGSGAGCSSSVFNGYLTSRLKNKEIKRLLLCPTGALLSKDTPLQGATIPGVAHAVVFEAED
ncbi:MAG: stage V sporulation protein AD [Clostridiaceae bacterium]|jgi:stage V sporulation protein AD|nr:stage V sporulation protein AD [Clostridiaceae bacterium]